LLAGEQFGGTHGGATGVKAGAIFACGGAAKRKASEQKRARPGPTRHRSGPLVLARVEQRSTVLSTWRLDLPSRLCVNRVNPHGTHIRHFARASQPSPEGSIVKRLTAAPRSAPGADRHQ
jgi:hypothetical protein